MTRPLCAVSVCSVLLLAAMLASGCRSMPEAASAGPPADFTLALTVFDDDAEIFRSARYIVEPDGVLRAGFGSGASTAAYPPWIRRLSSRQIQELWTIAGPIRADESGRSLPTDETFEPGDDPTVVVAIRQNGRWRYAAHALAETDAPNATIRLLDRFAWATPGP